MKTKYLKYYKKRYKILSLIIYIVLPIIIILSGYIFYVGLPFDYNTEIEFEGLNETEIIRVEHILQQVKPIYLNRTRKIKFIADNDSIFCGFPSIENKLKGREDHTRGCNWARNIVIRYTEKPYLWEVVCHELLHNWIREEIPTYDIENYNVCYY